MCVFWRNTEGFSKGVFSSLFALRVGVGVGAERVLSNYSRVCLFFFVVRFWRKDGGFFRRFFAGSRGGIARVFCDSDFDSKSPCSY